MGRADWVRAVDDDLYRITLRGKVIIPNQWRILIFPSAYFDTNEVRDGQHEWGVGGVDMGIWIGSGGF